MDHSLRSHRGYPALLAKAEKSYRESVDFFVEAGGNRLLGVTVDT